MGLTIHYRGTIDDINEIELMEDRVLDLVYSLGDRATIWRSFGVLDPSRVVRGLMIEMEPGQDTLALLLSPEGHLTPLFGIEEAEEAPSTEPPSCFVKTQFGSPLGHVAIVHLLDALNKRYFSNLTISDEGEYYETRDIQILTDKLSSLKSSMLSMADEIGKYGLSKEAAEDKTILATRIERIAMLVHKKLMVEQNDAVENTANDDQTDQPWGEVSLEDEIDAFDRIRRKNDLRNERMERRISEATASGLSIDEAFELAMREEGLVIPFTEQHDEEEESDVECIDEATDGEPWLSSLPSHPFDEESQLAPRLDHPAVLEARKFLAEVMDLGDEQTNRSSFVSILTRASFDIVGGLVQATSEELVDVSERALAISQLKRALTGHGFARGAIFGLAHDQTIDQHQAESFHQQLESILSSIQALTEEAWIRD